MLFDLKASDLLNLRRLYRKAPKKFALSIRSMVNGFAFGTRREALAIIEKKMVVRNKRFVAGRVQVVKARASRTIAEVGSVATQRFTGWKEQEMGSDTDRTRVFAIMARNGNYRRQALPSARLKPGANFIKPEDYDGKTNRFRTMAMLADIRRKKIRRPFLIKKQDRRFKPGLYRMVGGTIQQLQQFGRKRQPRRVHWMEGGIKAYFKGFSLRNEWAKAISHVFKKR